MNAFLHGRALPMINEVMESPASSESRSHLCVSKVCFLTPLMRETLEMGIDPVRRAVPVGDLTGSARSAAAAMSLGVDVSDAPRRGRSSVWQEGWPRRPSASRPPRCSHGGPKNSQS